MHIELVFEVEGRYFKLRYAT